MPSVEEGSHAENRHGHDTTDRPMSAPAEVLVASTDDQEQAKKSRTKSFRYKLKDVKSVFRISTLTIVPPPLVGSKAPLAAESRVTPESKKDHSEQPPKSSFPPVTANGHLPETDGPGLVGLLNHGNTCFVNAILQCLSNNEPLCKYFVLDQFRRDRRKMRSRHCSELTTQFALLLKSMWTCEYDRLLSAQFRRLIANASVQYQAQCQQDAQEFLLWLLNQLSEDLAYQKSTSGVSLLPFRRASAKNRSQPSDVPLANVESSFIFSLFLAHYRSTLSCPRCPSRSSSLEPFLCLSLSLPEVEAIRALYITVIFRNKARRPQLIAVAVPADHRGKEPHRVSWLKEQAARLTGLSEQAMLVISLDSTSFLNTYRRDDLIANLQGEVYIFEAPPYLPRSSTNSLASIGGSQSMPAVHGSVSMHSCSDTSGSLPPTLHHRLVSSTFTESSEGRPPESPVISVSRASPQPAPEVGAPPPPTSPNHGTDAVFATEPPPLPPSGLTFPADIRQTLLVLVLLVEGTINNGTRFGSPMSLRLYRDESLQKIKNVILKGVMRFATSPVPPEFRSSPDVFRLRVHNGLDKGTFLVASDPQPLYSAAVEAVLQQFDPDCGEPHIKLIAEWSEEMRSRITPLKREPVEDDRSILNIEERLRMLRSCSLDDCLKLHTQPELLTAEDAWMCPSCKVAHAGSKKRLMLSQLPGILVIHLKRFKQVDSQRVKLQTAVDFPLDNLDLAQYLEQEIEVCDRAKTSEPTSLLHSRPSDPAIGGTSTRYILFAVCNHFGTIYGGHYTAFCRNAVTNNWYKFDDTRVTLLKNPGDVITPSAYLLFYQRVDTCDQTSARHWVRKIVSNDVQRFLAQSRSAQARDKPSSALPPPDTSDTDKDEKQMEKTTYLSETCL